MGGSWRGELLTSSADCLDIFTPNQAVPYPTHLPSRSQSWRCAASWHHCRARPPRPASAGCSWRSCAAVPGITRPPPQRYWRLWLPRCPGHRWSMCSCCGTRASRTERFQRHKCWRSRRRSTAWRRPLQARRTTPASMPRCARAAAAGAAEQRQLGGCGFADCAGMLLRCTSACLLLCPASCCCLHLLPSLSLCCCPAGGAPAGAVDG